MPKFSNGAVSGFIPMYTKTPSASNVCSAPSLVDSKVTEPTLPSFSLIVFRVWLQIKSILSFLNARSCKIFCARSSSLRCTIVTLSANFVRNVPSSTAESPPPMTNNFLFLKNAPSHTNNLHRDRLILVHLAHQFFYIQHQ